MKIKTKLQRWLLLFISILFISPGYATHYIYHQQQFGDHVVHIVILNPNDYDLHLVKAKNRLNGRESVKKLAELHHADVALNGGFFLLDAGKEGQPAGNLIINGKVYHYRPTAHSHLIKAGGHLYIQQLPNFKIASGKIILPDPEDDDASKIVPCFVTSSNCLNSVSAVMGIPLLMSNGKINPKIFQGRTGFYLHPHARTAIGLRPNGDIVIVVAEHDYAAGTTTGLTIPELAKLMQRLGCQSALNLDGGGSSSLWIGGTVVNHPMGDLDEEMGHRILRPVSDAIILKKRNI